MERPKGRARISVAPVLFLAMASVCSAQTHWVGSWASSQQPATAGNALAPNDLRDTTLRQIVHLSVGGAELRVRLSNRFGTAPLHVTSVHIARPVSPDSPKIAPETDKGLTFDGATEATIPAGADYLSDPVKYRLAPLSDVAITLHIDVPPAQQTGHLGSRATSYWAHGDLVSAPDFSDANKVEHWYFIAGVDVLAPTQAAAIVVLGDSITDGHGATTDANNRWPDILAKRLQASSATQALAVLNEGIGGNRLLLDGIGQNALARFDQDVLAQTGVRYLIVLEGINDIGMLTHEGQASRAEHEALVARILACCEQMIARAHAHGIEVIGATILPFAGSQFYHPGPDSETDRQDVNRWIRAPGHFDAVIDFDAATRDPDHPDSLLPAFDSGDHLHPSPAGYAAMANAIPLSLFSAASATAAAKP
jgi:lysophospholipase L1-like esterase